MQQIGLKITNKPYSSYFHPYLILKENDSIYAYNVMAMIPGKFLNEYIIFSAHYDHVGNTDEHIIWRQAKEKRSDRIYNGANDNASGVATMLVLAGCFHKYGTPDYTILFIAFSGEEDGLLGSAALASSLY